MDIRPFQLERYFARYEFNTKYSLCSSDCESFTTQEILALEPGTTEKLMNLRLGYIDSRGLPALRQEIARMYERISPEQVLAHSGAGEAIFTFMHALLKAGDEVIIHQPCYQSLEELPLSLGCEIKRWKAHEKELWRLDMDDFKKLLSPKTKAVIINCPHNPTGYLMPKAQFMELSKICDERGIVLFSDEVYRESEQNSADRLPAACDLSEKAVSLGVMSKTYGLAGLRIGWAATRNAPLLKRMAELKDYTSICNSAPSEYLAEVALRHRDKLAARNVGIIKSNLTLLDKFFAEHTDLFRWHRPIAGSMTFVNLLKGEAESFCDKMVKEAGVFLLSGLVYGDYPHHFRLGFGRKNLPQALEQVEKQLNK